ncbi:hypothetical protein K2F40_03790 [Clostridium sp. CM028]|uniref:hypothetical protein n=1 Tax=unclassified Clostridium TaxID=2614128 RepID=UPI001C0B992C|nr:MULTISPECIES: hypothetical protein [unclassified Clostridium]MBU3092724.1 hypothetical protein [Clostridium sp. CF011]MBW9146779.1 hypothetical protein [Clostridium sp. CM027]MBW9148099.1 hypothetical protein [Clostridium sp. CM028]UVE41566.1 hypothetical protein KTC92_03510 [Clostridium sp. CM027]WAG70556.1 hypothetical protein LL036_03685 [Clostridium sp. CF011]
MNESQEQLGFFAIISSSHAYVFNNNYKIIKSGYSRNYNKNFASATACIYGRPAGTFWYGLSANYFMDSYYGNFDGTIKSPNMTW